MAGITRSSSEQDVVGRVRLDDAWALVEEFSSLVRESGSEEERQAVERIVSRLESWGVPHEVHWPELLISLPRAASLTVGGVQYEVKTAAMAAATDGLTAPIVYEAAAQARSVNDIFGAAGGAEDVDGAIVLTEGFPMPGRITELAERGAVGVIAISPGERIHEGIVTSVWGSPDLTTYGDVPTLPVVSISKPDGEKLVQQIAGGGVEATVVAEVDTGWREIPVIVADIRGSEEEDRFVLVHGHLDSWHVGIGDNATGDATLLELVRVLSEHRAQLKRSVRVAWWSGHSHGRYAGSTWFADEFALDIERNCICHINCDSPGCVDADVFEDVYAMAEATEFARQAIEDFAGLPSEHRPPLRAGDISFNNLGISTFFMLSSTMPAEKREAKGYYAVGGCGGNIEWHTEADTLDIADRDNLLRDIKVYTGAALRAANAPVHPLDFRATVAHIEEALRGYAERLGSLTDFDGTFARARDLKEALEALYATAGGVESIADARPVNDALLAIGRELVRVLYSRAGAYRQDPALHIAPLPEIAAAADAVGNAPDGVLRTELLRVRNRLDRALAAAADRARAATA